MKVLIADDDGTTALILSDVLVAWGYETVVVSDGDEAWRALHAADPPRLALVDWMMPGVSGVDLCRSLLASETVLKPYVILVTSKSRKEDVVAGLGAGANDFVSKPFDMDELRARVQVGARYVRLQESLARLNQELEHRVVERTAQLQVINRELEAFSFSVSHDLRAPLRHIGGFTQILLEDFAEALGVEGCAYLRKVTDASRRMERLIDSLLNLSRVARSELHRRQVDFTRQCNGVACELHETEPDRAVEFAIAEGLTVLGDAHLMRLVAQNLIGNAWKYTATTECAIIEVGKEETGGEEAFFVRDNGVGFDMSQAHRLFGAFQRLHAEEDFEGTGIGLATVQRIVHRHGGRVWADGAVGKGATFRFTIPRG